MREFGSAPRLDAILARAARSEPRRDAVVFDGMAWTYAEVYDRALRLAGRLAAFGVKKGDRVAYWSDNRPEFLEFLFGVSMLGAIASPLDHWWTWSDASAALAQLGAKILIVGSSQAHLVAKHIETLHSFGIERVLCLDDCSATSAVESYGRHLEAGERLSCPVPVASSDPAAILFTSGSTGRSKGAIHTHGSLVAAAKVMCMELRLQDGERTLHFLPLFSSCLDHLIPLTMMRATHVVLPQFDAREIWEAIRDHRITHFDAVPTTLRRIVDVAPSIVPPTLRMISYASEPMPAPLITTLIERLPSVEFVQFYGMIEHLCLTVLSASDQLRKIGTVGRPMFGTRLSLLNPGETNANLQSTGEIIANSATMFAGYWHDEAATAQVMRGEWMRTGDLGHFDDEGYLKLEGRVKEMIKTGGVTVIPSDVEAALIKHPGVKDVAVVGIPDEQWGEAVHAFVTLSSGAVVEEEELKSFCRERLAGYKRPKKIHIVAELPRTGIGKIARRQVRKLAIAQGTN